MPDPLDLRPRVLFHTPLGDTVVDPWQVNGVNDQLARLGITYEVVWGVPEIGAGQGFGVPLLSWGLLAGVIGIAVLAGMRRR